MSDLLGIVEGADFFLILSLIIFMLIFIAAIVYMLTIKKQTIDELSNLPLTEDDILIGNTSTNQNLSK